MEEELAQLATAEGAEENGSSAVKNSLDPASLPERPSSTTPSVGSTGSGDSGAKKRRTWKKPKDKPKRPLSAYNIFFKHERQRIVEGKEGYPTAEETIRSIEHILATSRETRRHRKTHGRISFGDLARRIADKWKAIPKEQKAVFEHYADIDMRRYRKDVKIWKEKKEMEALRSNGGTENFGDSTSSFDSLPSENDYDINNNSGSADPWGPRKNFYDSMNSSFSSAGSYDSEYGADVDPLPVSSGRDSDSFHGGRNMPVQLNLQMPMPMSSGNQYLGQSSDHSLNYGEHQYLMGHNTIGGQMARDNSSMMQERYDQSLRQSQEQQQSQLQQAISYQRMQLERLQRQQQELLMSAANTGMHLQPPEPVLGSRASGAGPSYEEPLPLDAASDGNASRDLEDFLSNLDLSNA